jgi:hypothetical protein
VLVCLPFQLGYSFVSGFSGVSMFNSLCVAAYNALLFVPVVFFFVDKDLSETFLTTFPQAYASTRMGVIMNNRTMLWWFVRALVQVRAGGRCGAWCVACDAWCVACDAWCGVFGVWRVACCAWCVACDAWCVWCVWRVACGVWRVACGMWRGVCVPVLSCLCLCSRWYPLRLTPCPCLWLLWPPPPGSL